MPSLLAVDGGTTKTVALVLAPDGTVAGAGRGGGSNLHGQRHRDAVDRALAGLDAAVSAALATAAISPGDLAVGAFSLSGADWPEDIDLLRGAVERRGYGRRLLVVNDGIGGLRAGSPDGCGVAVICGTGAAVAARAPSGRMWHSGYWQHAGAEGSIDLGRQVLRAVYRAELGLDPPTALTEGVLTLFGCDTVEDVLRRMTVQAPEPAPTVGGLVRPLLDAAERGDPAARQIVRRHGDDLGAFALVAARKVGLAATPFTLVLGGGVLRHRSSLLAEALVRRVRTTSPAVHVVVNRREPALGAALLALELGEAPIDDAMRQNLERTLPPAPFFET